jgi:hypothetical protein
MSIIIRTTGFSPSGLTIAVTTSSSDLTLWTRPARTPIITAPGRP